MDHLDTDETALTRTIETSLTKYGIDWDGPCATQFDHDITTTIPCPLSYERLNELITRISEPFDRM
jgi:hypothetical protein